MGSDGLPNGAMGFDIFGDFSNTRLVVASALATPTRSEAAGAATTLPLRPPAHLAYIVLPSVDSQTLSDNNADLFSSTSGTD